MPNKETMIAEIIDHAVENDYNNDLLEMVLDDLSKKQLTAYYKDMLQAQKDNEED
jgi:hypothetical protein